MAGWALVPLRAFLGFTFTFAGLQKLANPRFFTASNPASIQAQLAAAARRSPIHALVSHLTHLAVPLGLVIAFGEVAVGVATLVGLWGRVAACGGLVLSFSLFLTVSFHSSPYYTGSDIVFVFAWTPLIVAGAGGVLSVDAVLEDAARRRGGLGPGTVVPLPFDVVPRLCGAYDAGACTAMAGAPCAPAPCPYLRARPAAPAGGGGVDRRTFTLHGAAAAVVAGVALVAAGLAAGLGRALGGSSSGVAPTPALGSTGTGSSGRSGSGTSPSTGSRPPGTSVGAARDVPVGGAASFQDPTTGDPSLVVQPVAGTFEAFDAVCPHAGCIVNYVASAKRFICPCHGSEFNGRTGAVIQGPAPRGLGRIPIAEGSDGELYVT